MSTVDPAERDLLRARSRRRRFLLIIALCGGALVGGYGSSIFSDFPGGSYSLSTAGPLAKAGLLLAGTIATMLIIGVIVRQPDRTQSAGRFWTVLAIALCAWSVGLFVGLLLPTSIDEYLNDPKMPGLRANARWTCLALLVAAAAAYVWALIRSRSQRRRAELRRSERHTSAVITEVHDTGVRNNNDPWIRLTVKFQDAHGTDRWVRRRLTVSPISSLSVGDHVDLWFDPEDPGDEKKIVIGQA